MAKKSIKKIHSKQPAHQAPAQQPAQQPVYQPVQPQQPVYAAPQQPAYQQPQQPVYAAPQPVTAGQLMTSDSTKNFIIAFFVMLVVVFVVCMVWVNMNGGTPCPQTSDEGGHLCGYCNLDAALSDNPNAGQCRYCPGGYTCSYDNICGQLQCVGSGSDGSNGNGGYVNQMCNSGECYSGGYCCPGYAPYFCNNACYDTAGAHSAGCYTLKATCY